MGHSQILPLNSAKSRSKLCEYSIFLQGCLVQIFTTRGVVAPPTNNLIMSGTLIRSFRHLEHKNPSIISGDIGRASWMYNLGWTDRHSSSSRNVHPSVLYRIGPLIPAFHRIRVASVIAF